MVKANGRSRMIVKMLIVIRCSLLCAREGMCLVRHHDFITVRLATSSHLEVDHNVSTYIQIDDNREATATDCMEGGFRLTEKGIEPIELNVFHLQRQSKLESYTSKEEGIRWRTPTKS